MAQKREIVFDTETTGVEFNNGDRIIEIGAVELIDFIPTGKFFQTHLNPEGRPLCIATINTTGIKDEFLFDKPKFLEKAQEFLDFVGDSMLIAHNASFDMNFINMEFSRISFNSFPKEKFIDTLDMARKKFPGARNSLDALCDRYNVDRTSRTYHGALLDSEILAKVYFELMGGKEPGFALNQSSISQVQILDKEGNIINKKREYKQSRSFELTTEEIEAHEEYLKKIANPLWGIFDKKE